MKIKLYKVVPEYVYGDEREAKKAEQEAILKSMDLKEVEHQGFVICSADEALALMAAKYCGLYSILDHISFIHEVDYSAAVAEFMGVAIEKSVEAVASVFNEKTQQEQPGPALMAVTETMLMEDACTDALQENIADGWRILAICPQPQRRPDYVLGRSTPSLSQSARRG